MGAGVCAFPSPSSAVFVGQQVADKAYCVDAILNDRGAAGGGHKGWAILSE